MNKKVLGIIFLLLAQFALLIDDKKVNFVFSKSSNQNKNWNKPYSSNNKRKLRVKPVANFESLEFLRILNTRKIVADWTDADLVGMENF